MEPDESTEDRRRSGIKDEDKVLLPLDENVLTDNLGIPVVVVVTKVSTFVHTFVCKFGRVGWAVWEKKLQTYV